MKRLVGMLAVSALLGSLGSLPVADPVGASALPGDVASGAGSWQNGPNTITFGFTVGSGADQVSYSMSNGLSLVADVHCYNVQGNIVSIEAEIPAPLPPGVSNAGVYVYAVDNPGTGDDQVGYSFGSPWWWADCSAPSDTLWNVPGNAITVSQGVHGRIADMKAAIVADPKADHGTITSLLAQLTNIERSWEKGKIRPACSQLNGFVGTVITSHDAGKLSDGTYAGLLAQSAGLGAKIGCGS